jgi:hypothetical protein
MPKLAARCNNRRGQAQLVYGSGPLLVPPVAFSAPPRKVSFEDGHRDAASSSSSDDESSLPQQEQLSPDRSCISGFTAFAIPALQEAVSSRPLSGLRRKSTLIRPTTSQCLVALASLDEEEDNDDTAQIESNKRCRVELIRTDAPSPTQVFAELSVPVSPGPQDIMNGSFSSACSSGVSTPPVSPWGHFVDIVVASEEQQQQGRSHSASALLSSSNKCHHTHHDGRFNCCTSCRRRHAGPYGGVCNKKHTSSSSMSSPERRPLCFLQNDNDIRPLFPISMSSKGSRSTFKLQRSPRRDYEHPTEQLITALHHMRVD